MAVNRFLVRPSARESLHVGILHLGVRVHGVQRYGRMLAAELQRIDGVSVVEREATLTVTGVRGLNAAVAAARGLARADVVMVPYCRNGLWADSTARIPQILAIHLGLRRRTVAVLHDVYSPGGRRCPEWWAMALNVALPGAVVLHAEHERSVLVGMPGARGATVIPHFIEERRALARDAARQRLAVAPQTRVLGMIGWIHPRKNYELAVRALSLLGPEFRLWLVGAVPGEDRTYLNELRRLTADLGVSDRVLITGYVSEEELQVRLAALDLGLCPYHDASASGSMSTLLSARRPIVANDFELGRELRASAPQVITLVAEPKPERFADAIAASLRGRTGDEAFDALLSERSLGAVARRYLPVLRSASRRALT